MTWDDRFLDLARLVAGWSKDRSRKVGAVIVDGRNTVRALGWNGFPRGVNDDVDHRHTRPTKYAYAEHAERNAIFNAAATGVRTEGCRIYIPWFPCADCARAIIQAGLAEVICIEPDWDDPAPLGFKEAREMLEEASVVVRFVAGSAPVQGVAV